MDKHEVSTTEKPQLPPPLKTNQFDRRHKILYLLVCLIGSILSFLGLHHMNIASPRYVSMPLIILGLTSILAAFLLAVLGWKTSEQNKRRNLEAKIRYIRQMAAYEACREADVETHNQSGIEYRTYSRPEHVQMIALMNKLEAQGYSSVKIMETIEDPVYGPVLWCYLDHRKTYVIKHTGAIVSDQKIIDELDRKYGRSPEERRSGIIYD